MKCEIALYRETWLIFVGKGLLYTVKSICFSKYSEFFSHFQEKDKVSGQNMTGPSSNEIVFLFHSDLLALNPTLHLSNCQTD